MIRDAKSVKMGCHLVDPIGRKLEVVDVFVPKNAIHKQTMVPSNFRNWGRKVVVFSGGSVMPLTDAQRRYSLAS